MSSSASVVRRRRRTLLALDQLPSRRTSPRSSRLGIDEEDERVVEPVGDARRPRRRGRAGGGSGRPRAAAIDVEAQLSGSGGPAELPVSSTPEATSEPASSRSSSGAAAARSRLGLDPQPERERLAGEELLPLLAVGAEQAASAILASPLPHSLRPAARSAGSARPPDPPVADDRLVRRAVELERRPAAGPRARRAARPAPRRARRTRSCRRAA